MQAILVSHKNSEGAIGNLSQNISTPCHVFLHCNCTIALSVNEVKRYRKGGLNFQGYHN